MMDAVEYDRVVRFKILSLLFAAFSAKMKENRRRFSHRNCEGTEHLPIFFELQEDNR